jgi:hypothetical protein
VIPEAAGLRDHSSAPRAPLAGPWLAWVDAAALTGSWGVVPVDLQEKRQLDPARQVSGAKVCLFLWPGATGEAWL